MNKKQLYSYLRTFRDISEHVAILDTMRAPKEDSILDSYMRFGSEIMNKNLFELVYEYLYQTAITDYFEFYFEEIDWSKLSELGKFMAVKNCEWWFMVRMSYTDNFYYDDMVFCKFLRILWFIK